MSSGNLKKNLCFDPLVSLNPSKEKYYYLQSISFFNVRDYVITRVFENLIKRLKKKKNRKKIERVMDFYGISSISALSSYQFVLSFLFIIIISPGKKIDFLIS